MIMIIHHSATKDITAAASSTTTAVSRPSRHFRVKLSALYSVALSPAKLGNRRVKRSHDGIRYGSITFLEYGPSHHPNSTGAFHQNISKKARYHSPASGPMLNEIRVDKTRHTGLLTGKEETFDDNILFASNSDNDIYASSDVGGSVVESYANDVIDDAKLGSGDTNDKPAPALTMKPVAERANRFQSELRSSLNGRYWVRQTAPGLVGRNRKQTIFFSPC